jgi:SAM-dependent methyltransferase/uncharacterized protein YbaR (Trm112 family)
MREGLVELLRCPRSGAPLGLDAHERDGEEIEFGLLRGPAGDYPVVAGIPILLDDPGDGVVAAVTAGDHPTATALAVARGVPLSRLEPLVPTLLSLRPTRSLGQWLAGVRDRNVAARAGHALAASTLDPEPLLRLAHLESRSRNVEGFRYFRFRLGLPRHLVALGSVAASRPPGGPVVEVGCGAGHMTWQLQRLLAPRAVVGVEREFHLLWTARHHIAPDADLVCADTTSLPLGDRSCSLAIAVDVLSFVAGKAVASRELRRVVDDDGGLVLTSLINGDADHEFAGNPLPVAAWAGLVGDLPSVGFADRTVLDCYLDGWCPPPAGDDAATLEASRTVTLLAGPAALDGLGSALDGWPHAVGRLGPHPLLAPADPPAPGVRCWRRTSPSPGFDRDNADLDRYLPAELCLDAEVVAAARSGERPPALDAHVATAAVLGHPARWPADPWSPELTER